MKRAIACFVVLLAATVSCWSQTYPSRPIRIVFPFPAGGGGDSALRLIAQNMSEHLKQSIIVENMAGANGRIGTHYVANAAPDGYAVLLGSAGPITIGPLVGQLTYDPLKDLIPISIAFYADAVITVGKTFPAQDFGGFLAEVRKNPGKYSFGTAGVAGHAHLAGELLKLKAGLDMKHVPYRGDAPAIQDLLGGHIPICICSSSTIVSYIASDEVRAIATMGTSRNEALPNVPTAIESGLTGVIGGTWLGFFVPARTPGAVVDLLNATIKNAVNSPAIRQKLVESGNSPVGNSPAEFAAILREENSRYEQTIKEGNIKFE